MLSFVDEVKVPDMDLHEYIEIVKLCPRETFTEFGQESVVDLKVERRNESDRRRNKSFPLRGSCNGAQIQPVSVWGSYSCWDR